MFSTSEYFCMGTGDSGHAIFIRADMWEGSSYPTRTYGNPSLASSEEFVVQDLELWGLDEVT